MKCLIIICLLALLGCNSEENELILPEINPVQKSFHTTSRAKEPKPIEAHKSFEEQETERLGVTKDTKLTDTFDKIMEEAK